MALNPKQVENYYNAMAMGKLTQNDMKIVNQTGRGFKLQRSKNLYSLGQWGGREPDLTTVSPIDQDLKQAKSNIRDKNRVAARITGIKRKRATSLRGPRTKRRKRSTRKKKKGKRRRKQSTKKKKRTARKSKKRGRKGRKGLTRKIQDALS